MLEHLERLFAKNNATLALWGHLHRYERFSPVCNFTCGSTWKGFLVHIAVIGMAGQDWQPMHLGEANTYLCREPGWTDA